jgi:hypothetical protein
MNINDFNGFQALMEAHTSYTIIKKKKTRTIMKYVHIITRVGT